MLHKLKNFFVLQAVIVGSLWCFSTVAAAPVTVVALDTNGLLGSEVTVSATTVDANLNAVTVSRGVGISIPPIPPANTFVGDSFLVGGLKANAIALGEYFQFSVSPKATYKVSFSTLDFNVRRSSTGPSHYQWQYSFDGFATAGIDVGLDGTYVGTVTGGAAMPQIDMSVVPALQNIQAGTTVTFRLYAWGATDANGTFAIGRMAGDDLKIMGNVDLMTYDLNYSAGANGSLTGDTAQTVTHGSDGTAVTAVPDVGYHFVDWSDASTDNPRTDLAVTGDITVTANFAINTYTLTYSAGVGGSLLGDVLQSVNYGSDGTAVTAVPDAGYHFVDWDDTSTDNPRQDLNVGADVTVTANFSLDTYTLTYGTDGHGTISGSAVQTVSHGSDGSTVTAVADSGYKFLNWSDGVNTAARTDLNITANLNVTANFRKLTNPIIYVPVGTGTGLIDQAIPMDETKVVGKLDQGGINILSYLNGQANFEAKESRSRLLAWHHIKILNVDMAGQKVTVEVSSTPQTFVMNLEEEILVDLDADKIKDISIKYEDLQVNRVELTVKSVLTEAGEATVSVPAASSVNVPSTESKTCPGNFSRDLKQGMNGADVKALQVYLNQQGFSVATVGVGSVGNETEYFGALTKSALTRYQQAKGIAATSGEFDLVTRVYLGCASASVAPNQTANGKHRYNRNLDLGMSGADVKELQKFLNSHGFTVATEGSGSPGNETEDFGILTKQALARYQADQEIVPANGVFSDWTRWWLNKQ